jgi:hypothetical protein
MRSNKGNWKFRETYFLDGVLYGTATFIPLAMKRMILCIRSHKWYVNRYMAILNEENLKWVFINSDNFN